MGNAPVKQSSKSASQKSVMTGKVHIYATFNNTIVTITDEKGNKLCSKSGGEVGFKGARKSTPYAAQLSGEAAGKLAIEKFKMKQVHIKMNGCGPGRESAARAIKTAGLKVLSIEEGTGVPHNGCRPPKERRV